MALQPTAADIEYMKEHIGDDRRGGIIAVKCRGHWDRSHSGRIAGCIAPTHRGSTQDGGLAHDSGTGRMPIVAVLFTGYAISYCVATHYGAGRHAILVTKPKALTEVGQIGKVKNNIATSEFIVGIVAACFPTYRPLYKWASRTGDSHSSTHASANGGLGKEQRLGIEMKDKAAKGNGRMDWKALPDDEERLVRTTVVGGQQHYKH
ncbi:MAG: hypothetical protein Q9222_002792 [Ikaeria aurantiellina]